MVRSNFLTNRFDFLVRFVSIQNERMKKKQQAYYHTCTSPIITIQVITPPVNSSDLRSTNKLYQEACYEQVTLKLHKSIIMSCNSDPVGKPLS